MLNGLVRPPNAMIARTFIPIGDRPGIMQAKISRIDAKRLGAILNFLARGLSISQEMMMVM